MSRRVFMAVAALVALSGAALALWKQRGDPLPAPPEPATARATVLEYLHALEVRDPSGILNLVPHDYDAGDELAERLQRFGGARAHEAHIQITAEISPEILSVRIRTTGPDGQELAWTENLFWHDGAWKLVLGGRRDGRPVSDIQRPKP